MAITAAELQVRFSTHGDKEAERSIESVGDAVDRVGGRAGDATGGFDAFYESIRSGAGPALDALDGISRAMGSIALMGGITLIAGGARAAWQQVDAVQQATVALRAYEQNAEAVDEVLQDLVSYARSDLGVLFQRQDLFRAAQGLKVMGAETQHLTRYVEIMSRSVGVGAGNWDELTRVIGRVGSTGRLAGEDFDMLTKMGYQLDSQLRNTSMSWEELFNHLDRGIPINALEGQANTIQGILIRLQSAIRNIGIAFLGVDPETSQFIEGGLGDHIVNSLIRARDVLSTLGPIAEGIGGAISTGLQMAGNVISFVADQFARLPDSIQTATRYVMGLVAAMSMLRAGGGIAAAMMAIPGLQRLLGAAGITGTWSTLGTVARSTGGIMTAALTVAAGAAIGMYNRIQDMISASRELDQVWNNLKLEGDDDLANSLEQTRESIDGIIKGLEGSPWWNPIKTGFTVPSEIRTAMAENIQQIFTDARIDTEEFLTWFSERLIEVGSDPDLQIEFLREMSEPDFPTRFRAITNEINGTQEAMRELAVAASDVDAIFADMPVRIDDLNIEGKVQEARDLLRLQELLQEGFTYEIPIRYGVEHGLGAPLTDMQRVTDLTEAQVESLDAYFNRISNLMASGDFDNAAIISEIEAILSADHLDATEKLDQIGLLQSSMADYKTNLDNARDAMRDWLAVGDNFLDFWLEYDSRMNAAGAVMVENEAHMERLEAKADFRALVEFTRDVEAAGDALDRALYYFQQIDALGQRSSAAAGIADNLFGPGGNPWDGVGPLRDIFDDGRISYEQFLETIEAGVAIQESDARIQSHLTKMRADQLPLLAEEQLAYERQIEALSNLGPLEQRRALAMMDSAYQTQMATMYSTAYAASIGEIPEEVASSIILRAAEADPILQDLLFNFGLIEEGVDGELRVNFPDADTVQDAIRELTDSIRDLIDAIGQIPGVSIDTSEVDPAIAKLNEFAEAARNAMLTGIGNIGAGGNNAARTGSRDAGTWGDTGVPVVTGLPQTGSGTVTLDVIDNVSPVLDDLSVRLYGFDGLIATVTVEADTSAAADPLNEVIRVHNDLSQNTAVVNVDADTALADSALDALESRRDDLDGSQAIVYLHAIDFASSTINAVSQGLSVLDGSTATVSIGATFGGFNIPGRATGGFVSEDMTLVGERGPELVSLPRGSYVHTNAETMRMVNNNQRNTNSTETAKGDTYDFSSMFAGAVFNNTSREEMNAWARENLIPAVERANDSRRRQMGVG